jgi:chromosome segregation ATPase
MRLRIAAIIVTGFVVGSGSADARAGRMPISAAPAAQEQTQPQAQGTQQDSVAEAARKAREKAKTSAPAKKTYTNDNVPALRGNQISVMNDNGNAVKDTAPNQAKPGTTAEPKKDEAYWRKRFADARTKLAIAESDLDVSQRELNLLQTQYYADPNKALQQQLTRDDINAKTTKVDEKKEEVAKLTQAIEDLKDELRHAGGEPGWGN